MRIAIVSVTEKGRAVSARLRLHGHDIKRFCFAAHCDEDAESFDKIGGLCGRILGEYDAVVFVCACGIAVRAAAPYIVSKSSDPAVVVIDDGGKFSVSLLSGHLGGANRLAALCAEELGAQAVITTSTDVGGLFSPDSFAAANGLIITDMAAAKAIAAAVTNGEKIGFASDYPCTDKPSCFKDNAEKGIVVSADEKSPFSVTLSLIPRNIVLGIGCKKGTDKEVIKQFVNSVLSENKIDIRRVCSAASIDLKSEEAGLVSFCKELDIPFRTYSAEMLSRAEGEFAASAFVSSVTGVDNVCERSAVMSGGKLILRKKAGSGVTVAAAELPVLLDFKKEVF